jgi:hypothetical protein
MGWFFGVASREDCVANLFYGTDYHGRLGTRRGGLAAAGSDDIARSLALTSLHFQTVDGMLEAIRTPRSKVRATA